MLIRVALLLLFFSVETSCDNSRATKPVNLTSIPEVTAIRSEIACLRTKGLSSGCGLAISEDATSRVGKSGELIRKTSKLDACVDALRRQDRHWIAAKSAGRCTNLWDNGTVKLACRPVFRALSNIEKESVSRSPFSPGGFSLQEADKSTISRIVQIIENRIDCNLAARNYAQAMRSSLKLVAFSQEIERGGVSCNIVHIASSSAYVALKSIGSILNTPGALSPIDLQKLESRLFHLLGSEPKYGSVLVAEFFSQAVNRMLPVVGCRGTSSSTRNCKVARSRNLLPKTKTSSRSFSVLRNISALSLVASWDVSRYAASECHYELYASKCVDRLLNIQQLLAYLDAEHIEWMQAYYASFLADLKTGRRTQHQMSSQSIAAEFPKDYTALLKAFSAAAKRCLLLRAERGLRLSFLRLHAAFELLRYADGKCPSLSSFKEEPLRYLLLDPYSGKRFRVSEPRTGFFRISSGEWNSHRVGVKEIGHVMKCKRKAM